MPATECLLATLPAADPNEQTLVVLINDPATGSRISLRQQSWGEGVGWFTQKTIDLDSEQVRQFRGILGTASPQVSVGTAPRSTRGFPYRLVHPESA